MRPAVKPILVLLSAALLLAPLGEAGAAKKAYTEAEKKKICAEALAACRKKFKSYMITHVEVKFNPLRVTCYPR